MNFTAPFKSLFLLFFLSSSICEAQFIPDGAAQIDSLHFVDEYVIPTNKPFQNTRIGGLSGIDFDGTKTYYLISDDRSKYSQARFYTLSASYTEKGFSDISLMQVHPVLTKKGKPFAKYMSDTEAIRWDHERKVLYYSSEGDRVRKVAPFIYAMKKDGSFVKDMPLPKDFSYSTKDDIGLHNNGALESLSLSPDGRYLWFANEEPLKQDGPLANLTPTQSPIRITKLDLETNKIVAQYAYMLAPIPAAPKPDSAFKNNSVPDLLAINDSTIWMLERAYSAGTGNFARVFVAHLKGATNVLHISSLKGQEYTPARKTLLFDFADLPVRKPDNIEGVTFGPNFNNGHPAILFISDDNFSKTQETQLWLFEGLNE